MPPSSRPALLLLLALAASGSAQDDPQPATPPPPAAGSGGEVAQPERAQDSPGSRPAGSPTWWTAVEHTPPPWAPAYRGQRWVAPTVDRVNQWMNGEEGRRLLGGFGKNEQGFLINTYLHLAGLRNGPQMLQEFERLHLAGVPKEFVTAIARLRETVNPGEHRGGVRAPHADSGDPPSYEPRTTQHKPADLWSALGGAYGDPSALGRAGELRNRGGDHSGAFRDYSSALSLGPPKAELLAGRGLAAERLGDSELAHRDAAAALKLDPRNPMAESLFRLTEGKVSRVRLKPQTEGLERTDAAKVAELPGSWDGKAPDPAAALAAARAKSGIPPSMLQRHGELLRDGDAALRRGDAAGAVSRYGAAVQIDGGNAQGFIHRAAAWLRLGNAKAAMDDAGRAVALAPRSSAAFAMRASARNALGDWRNALSDASEATRLNPRESVGFEARAHALAGLRDRAGALAALREAAALGSSYAGLLEKAERLPEDGDLLSLFGGGPGSAAAGPVRPASSARRLGRGLLLGGALGGGFLLALGLLHLLRPEVTGRITTAARFGGVFQGEPRAEASGFWRRYVDVRELATGGMGVVYQATDPRLGRRVAVKRMREEIRADPRERARFLAEARTVAALRHENIVGIYAIEEDGEDAFLVFEYVEGRTLADILAERGRLGLREALGHFRGVCEALQYAHERSVVHRDLKPSNVMVDPEGKVRVMDFGLARLAKDALTRLSATQTVAGTPPYMAPEAEQGLVCKQSDVFSLGVCLYEALTGRLPFSGTAAAALLKKMAGEFEPASALEQALPPAVDRLLASALDPKPETRLRTPRDFLAALEQAALTAGLPGPA